MFHSNQIALATSVVDSILNGMHAHCIVAPTQSGKTGCMAAIIHELKKYPKFENHQFVVACPMPYKDLRRQTITEMIKNYHVLRDESEIMFQPQLQKAIKTASGSGSGSGTGNRMKPIVILVDEAHWGSDNDSIIHKYLKSVGVTPDGHLEKWTNPDSYVLTISATPMAEVANYYNYNKYKQLHEMKPGPNYYGFEQMMNAGRLIQTERLDFNHLESLTQLMDAIRDHIHLSKYMIIRIDSGLKGKLRRNIDVITEQLDRMPVDVIKATTDQDSDIHDVSRWVIRKPSRATVIIIYSRLRAGIQLDTTYVSMVYDHSDKCDVTAQGLAGRCTGYNKENHQVDVYCNVKLLENYLKWHESSYDYTQIPHNSKNIRSGAGSSSNKKHHMKHVPLMIRLPVDYVSKFANCQPKRLSKLYREYRTTIWNEVERQINHGCLYYQSPVNLSGKNKSDITVINSLSSQKTIKVWWSAPFNSYLKGTPHGFGETQGLDPDTSYRAIFINANESDENYCKALLIYMTPRIETLVETTHLEQFHPDNNETTCSNLPMLPPISLKSKLKITLKSKP